MSRSDDAGALDRSERLLSSAPPYAVEQVHVAAFERLTPAEREAVFDRLSRTGEPPPGPTAPPPRGAGPGGAGGPGGGAAAS
ncbi:hypothetical protein ACFWEJ_10725, partial [Promicromonospora sp. NPDC060204]